MKLKTIASSSSGNAFILDNFLIDCGVESVPGFEYILITHTHGDHDKYFLKHLKKAKGFTTSEGTLEEILEKYSMYAKKIKELYIKPSDLNIKTFDMAHDKHCTAFLIDNGINTYLHITDTGHVNLEGVNNVDFLTIEANHDLVMLETGEYNEWLKNRVKETHLNNEQAINVARSLKPKYVNFVHMSAENNSREELEGFLEELKREGKIKFEYTINGGF